MRPVLTRIGRRTRAGGLSSLTMDEQQQTSRNGRTLLIAGLHLGALWALAVAEPLFDLMHKNPDFLAARRMV